MGWQHGRQVEDLRSHILTAMQHRLASLDKLQGYIQPTLKELSDLWELAARPTMDMLHGIAEALSFGWEPFFRYTVASYLTDRAAFSKPAEGCTVWAAAAPLTKLGKPLMAKNRDYRPDHQGLQCLAHARPIDGYDYLYLTSAGSPGVFSSGMNEMGLAVADTHVSSSDIGPGLARYSVMMEILEHHSQVSSAIQFLTGVTHLGDGTLTLIDADGQMAVFETGHSRTGIVRPENGFVVSTNHYVTPGLASHWLENNAAALRGNSQARQSRIKEALHSSRHLVDVAWAKKCMAQHGTQLDAICRHPEMESDAVTISTIVFQPMARRLSIANGFPCQSEFQDWAVKSSPVD